MIDRITVTMNGCSEDHKKVLAIHGAGEAISGMDENGYHIHCLLKPTPVTMVEMLLGALDMPSVLSISYERNKRGV